MRNEIHNVQTGNILQTEEIDRLRLLLGENRHENIAAGDLLLATGLHVKDSSLQHTLKTQRRLDLGIVFIRQ